MSAPTVTLFTGPGSKRTWGVKPEAARGTTETAVIKAAGRRTLLDATTGGDCDIVKSLSN